MYTIEKSIEIFMRRAIQIRMCPATPERDKSAMTRRTGADFPTGANGVEAQESI